MQLESFIYSEIRTDSHLRPAMPSSKDLIYVRSFLSSENIARKGFFVPPLFYSSPPTSELGEQIFISVNI